MRLTIAYLIIILFVIFRCNKSKFDVSIIEDYLYFDKNEDFIFVYINDNGCNTCNLNILKKIKKYKSKNINKKVIGYFATHNEAYWKRIIKVMNLNYKIYYGNYIKKLEKNIYFDGYLILNYDSKNECFEVLKPRVFQIN